MWGWADVAGESVGVIRFAVVFLGGLLLTACGDSDPLATLERGERGRVVRVIDGDALVLNTGQSVRLIGIEAPARPYREREGQVFHEEAKRMLEDMALGREVELRYGGLTRDRYDRALAHVVTDDALGAALWLNLEMAKRGGARLRVYPDTAAANDLIAEAEGTARAASRGLWSERAYDIPSAADLPEDFERFQLVEGILGRRSDTAEEDAVCDRRLLGSHLRLSIERSAEPVCAMPEGTKVIARGYIYKGKMEITHPLNVQTLPRD